MQRILSFNSKKSGNTNLEESVQIPITSGEDHGRDSSGTEPFVCFTRNSKFVVTETYHSSKSQ